MKQTYTIDELGIQLNSMPTGSFNLCVAWVENSFRVCVQGAESREILYYRQYNFLQITSFKDALHELKEIVSTDVLFSDSYKSIKIGVGGRMELTPKEFATEVLPAHLQQDWPGMDIMATIPFDEALREFYDAFFPKAQYVILPLQWIMQAVEHATEKKFFVQIDAYFMSVFYATSPKDILFFNTFEFKTFEDFAYYSNLIAQELQINREETELVLSGDVVYPSKVYDTAYMYFRKVSFLETDAVVYSKLLAAYPKHQNIHLFSL